MTTPITNSVSLLNKIKTALLLLSLLTVNVYSSPNAWQWASKFGYEGVPDFNGSYDTQALGIATDMVGNSYVVGYFDDPATWDNVTLTTNPVDSRNAFFAKYDDNGKLVWIKQISGNTYASSVAIDPKKGNIYVGGNFTHDAWLDDNFKLNNITAHQCSFLAKYDDSGNISWAQKFSCPADLPGSDTTLNAIAADGAGNIYITGTFYGKIALGNILLNANPANSKNGQIFVAKFNADGIVQWAQQAGSPLSERWEDVGKGIAVSKGKVYVTGSFSRNSADFGGIMLSCGDSVGQTFVACYDAFSGVIQWARQTNSLQNGPKKTGFSSGRSIAADEDGNCYITGYFSKSLIFNFTYLNSGGGNDDFDAFVVKYNATGDFLWVRQEGGFNRQMGNGISLDSSSKSLYVAGVYIGFMQFSDGAATGVLAPSTNVFVICYNLDGTILFKKRVLATTWPGFTEDVHIAHSRKFPNKSFYITSVFGGSPTLFEHQLNTLNGLSLPSFIEVQDVSSTTGGYIAKYESAPPPQLPNPPVLNPSPVIFVAKPKLLKAFIDAPAIKNQILDLQNASRTVTSAAPQTSPTLQPMTSPIPQTVSTVKSSVTR